MDATPLTFIGGSGPDEVYAGAGADNLRGEGGDDGCRCSLDGASSEGRPNAEV